MKLSQNTLALLTNFVSINDSLVVYKGNILRTISGTAENCFVKALVEEDFPIDFAIFELQKFLRVHSLFSEPEIDFEPTRLIISNEYQSVIYNYASVETIPRVVPNKDINFPSHEIEFDLTKDALQQIKKAIVYLELPEIAIVGDGRDLMLQAVKSQVASSNEYRVKLGNTNHKCAMIIKAENLKMLPLDYKVFVSSRGIVQFNSSDLFYWIATEGTSKWTE